MKKTFLSSIFIVLSLLMNANPIASPTIGFNELYFDSTGNWTIELFYCDFDKGLHEFQDSSIVISSAKETAYLKKIEFSDEKGIIVINNNSLFSDFIIDPNGDSLTINILSNGHYYTGYNALIYGKWNNSKIYAPKRGNQSIARFSNYNIDNSYSIDNSPTIDSIGMCGTLKGKILDKNNKPIGKKYMFDFIYPLKIDDQGNYTTRVYSNSMGNIFLKFYYKRGTFHLILFDSVSYTMSPDSVVTRDLQLNISEDQLNEIYIEDSIEWNKYYNIESISDEKLNSQVFSIIPNPVSFNSSIKYNINLPVKATESYIELFNLEGKKIKHYRLTENKGEIEIPDYLKRGVYLFQLSINKRKIASAKIVLNK